jgi:Tfp pilus assembly protein PilO
MRFADRIVMIGLTAVALIAVFWFVLLAPKRQEASDLKGEVEQLESAVAEQQETIAFAEEARRKFPGDYRRLVTLGKAVPEDDDTSSLFVQLGGISRRAGVGFRALELSEAAAGATGPAPAPPPSPPPEEEGSVQEQQQATAEVPGGEGTTSTPTGTAAPTEAAAASLPIGATVGSAGLPVMPYALDFQGDFFRIADFMRGLDSLVSLREGRVRSRGRLLTIDGFVLSRDLQKGFPSLIATLAVTTYVTPSAQGLTGGATPAGPTSPPVPSATPTSSTTTTTTAAETAPAETASAPAATEGVSP